MGLDVYAQLGYGFVIKDGESWQDPLFDALDELSEVELPSNDGYALESYMIEEFIYDIKGVETLTFGSYDYPTIAIVVTDSVQSSDSWSASPLKINMQENPEWNELLANTCETLGLDYKESEWLFGALYSH